MDEKRKKNMLLLSVIVLILVFSVIITAVNLMEANRKRQEAEKLAAEKRELEQMQSELIFRCNSPIDDAYVERVARDKLGLCYPDEIIYYNDLNK